MGDAQNLVLRACAYLLRAFFRRIEVSGLEHVPAHGGGVVVSWHPNGLIDPALILTQFPRRVVFGARHGLFKVPVLGTLMRTIGTVPIYRAEDGHPGAEGDRKSANQASLDALARAIAEGSFSALFPEGVSHDDPHLRELRPGVAKLYYQARRLSSGAPPVIIPVGLHYDDKHVFRSSALVRFHPPLVLPPDLDVTPAKDEPADLLRERQQCLMRVIEGTLHDAVGATEDWRIHQAIHRARKLVRAERSARAGAEPGQPNMRERELGFARVRKAYLERVKSHPEEVKRARRRLEEYDADLRTLGLDDHELDQDPRLGSPRLFAWIALQLVGVFLLLPPVVLVGTVVNFPTAALLWVLGRAFASKVKDEATLKLLGGIVLFPATWVLLGLLAVWARASFAADWTRLPHAAGWTFTFAVAVAAIGGALALGYVKLVSQALRSARVRLTRRLRQRSLRRLRAERAQLFEELILLSHGVELPGRVDADGRVV
jgi:glycerol-3-phosphate O-acyltransferase / dihydroxyacetone phosphate acyltransferase